MREVERLAIIKRASELGMNLCRVTKNENASRVLSVPEDYPSKVYPQAGNWIERVLDEDLFDWQEDLGVYVLSALSIFFDGVDVTTLDKEVLKLLSVEGHRLEVKTKYGYCRLSDDFTGYVVQGIEDGKSSEWVQAAAYLIYCTYSLPEESLDVVWAAEALYTDLIEFDDASIKRLCCITEKEQQLLDFFISRLRSVDEYAPPISLDGFSCEDVDGCLRVLEKNEEVLTNDGILISLAHDWLGKGSLSDLEIYFEKLGSYCIEASQLGWSAGQYQSVLNS